MQISASGEIETRSIDIKRLYCAPSPSSSSIISNPLDMCHVAIDLTIKTSPPRPALSPAARYINRSSNFILSRFFNSVSHIRSHSRSHFFSLSFFSSHTLSRMNLKRVTVIIDRSIIRDRSIIATATINTVRRDLRRQ